MKTKLKNTHDYITLTVHPIEGARINFTWARYHEKITASYPRELTDAQKVKIWPKVEMEILNRLMHKHNETRNPGETSRMWNDVFAKAKTIEEAYNVLVTK